MVPTATKVGTLNFSGSTILADKFQFTAVLLPTPPVIPSGWFSIAADSNNPTCHAYIGPSDEGPATYWRFWGSDRPGSCGQDMGTGPSIAYCFVENKPGACCNDQTALCDPNSNQFTCAQVGGRFAPAPATCAGFSPVCGQGTGACCYDNGTTAITTYGQCVGEGACCVGSTCTVYSQAACTARGGTYKGNATTCPGSPPWCNVAPTGACCTNYVCTVTTQAACTGIWKGAGTSCTSGVCKCIGDVNCDGLINYADINPFVKALGSLSLWQAQYPNCPWQNCDINGDSLVNYADINPFVAKLSNTGPCPSTLTFVPEASPDKSQGPVWLGPGTLISSCCTIVPGTPNEGEANPCTTDTVNAGCNYTGTPLTTLPALNTWVYGTSGTFIDPNGLQLRDTDWYTFTLTGTANHVLTISFDGEFDIAVELLHPGSCDPNAANPYLMLHSGSATKCTADPNTTAIVSRCLPSGTYWLVVAPQAFTGVPCGADYRIRVDDNTAANCTICTLTCPTTGTIHNELEPCGGGPGGPDPNNTDWNYGCGDPNAGIPDAFEYLGKDWNGTICGTTYTNNVRRDVDEYSFQISTVSNIKWTVNTEVPLLVSVLFNGSGSQFVPAKCTDTGYNYYAYLFTPCSQDSSATYLFYNDPLDPNVPYWLLVAPQDAGGFLLDAYPCPSSWNTENFYQVALTTTVLTCPTVCTAYGWQTGLDVLEGEPNCIQGYAATNNGCDQGVGDPNKITQLIERDDGGGGFIGRAVCGTTGIFLNAQQVQKTDYDWYKFTIPAGVGTSRLTIRTAGEVAYNIEIYRADPAYTCATMVLQERLSMIPCTLTEYMTSCYPEGLTLWLRLFAVGTPQTAPCGKKYLLRVTSYGNEACTQCALSPWPPSGTNENEACGTDLDGGCDSTPNPLSLNIVSGQKYYGTIWADNGANDTDYYKIVIDPNHPQYLRWTANAEFPMLVLLANSPLACPLTSAIDAGVAGTDPNRATTECKPDTVWTILTDPNDPTSQVLLSGTFYIVVQPGRSSPQGWSGINEGYPCAANPERNRYWILVETRATKW